MRKPQAKQCALTASLSATHMNTTENKLTELEVLRGVAILLTIVAHLSFIVTWNPAWLEVIGGNHAFAGGVDLFFCISGYVITTNLVRHAPSQRAWHDLKEIAIPFWKNEFSDYGHLQLYGWPSTCPEPSSLTAPEVSAA